MREYARAHQACDTVVVCAQLESDLADLSPEEGAAVPGGAGRQGDRRRRPDPRHLRAARACAPFSRSTKTRCGPGPFPAGTTAAKAAGRIHTDFERGFIKAERVFWENLVRCGSVGHARELGYYAHEGRDYVVRDGDVLLFKFNV